VKAPVGAPGLEGQVLLGPLEGACSQPGPMGCLLRLCCHCRGQCHPPSLLLLVPVSFLLEAVPWTAPLPLEPDCCWMAC
jgi:hypothetical protein